MYIKSVVRIILFVGCRQPSRRRPSAPIGSRNVPRNCGRRHEDDRRSSHRAVSVRSVSVRRAPGRYVTHKLNCIIIIIIIYRRRRRYFTLDDLENASRFFTVIIIIIVIFAVCL